MPKSEKHISYNVLRLCEEIRFSENIEVNDTLSRELMTLDTFDKTFLEHATNNAAVVAPVQFSMTVE